MPPPAKPDWVLRLEAKHGLPIDQIPGTVYALCYAEPLHVWSVSVDYSGTDRSQVVWAPNGHAASRTPIRHYVGWTQQRNPRRRINNHHRAGTAVEVTLSPGTMHDEEHLKRTATCPTCGHPYAADLLT